MIKVIDRRQRDIESLRKINLEAYFLDKSFDSEVFMNLGLSMYIEEEKYLKKELYKVFHKSRFKDSIILHPQQAEVLNVLSNNDNILLSAPTSFGKTFVALEYMARNDFNNIVIIVPTLALMNELSSKINKSFSSKYNLITNSFEKKENKNIYILVPERIDNDLLGEIKEVDLLIFDEVYKLKRSTKKEEQKNKRIIALNRGYFDMVNIAKKVILLGPFIKDIKFENTRLSNNIVKYFSDYAPVYTKTDYINTEKELFVSKEFDNGKSKLIYFKSPTSIYKFCSQVDFDYRENKIENNLTKWCDQYVSPMWMPSKMLKKGIGVHHGSLPSFIRRYLENLYNKKIVKNMLCTSTLLEGINTPTSELIIYDSDKLTPFEANNLIGRVGRLDTYQIGNVYYFDKRLENYIIGDQKYEEICIIAEDKEILHLEEILYLSKNNENLSEEQKSILKELNDNLNLYGKQFDDLYATEGFTIDEIKAFLNIIPTLFEKLLFLKECINSSDKDVKKKTSFARSEIIKLFQKVIPNKKKSIIYINKDFKDKISESVCINSLLAKNPTNIYDKMQKQIEKQQANMSTEKLNLFIDYLFDLSFSYIKYELNKIVNYCNFIFDEKYVSSLDKSKLSLITLLNEDVLQRFEMFNSDNNKIMKILLDQGIPYSDAKEIEKIIKKKIDVESVSTGKILKFLENEKEALIKNSKINNVTKDLIEMII